MVKKKSVAKLKKELDKVFSLYIRLRDSDQWGYGACITCSKRLFYKDGQAGHFIPRSCNELRYDEYNVNMQCYGCNVMKHGEQYKHGLAINEKYGEGITSGLYARRFITRRFTTNELEELIRTYKTLLKDYSILT